MGHLVTACMFCLLCAAHTQCSSHHDITNSHVKANSAHNSYNDGGGGYIGSPQFSQDSTSEKAAVNRFPMDSQLFVQSVFKTYGDGETISIDGFKRMLRSINMERIVTPTVNHETNESKDNSSHHNHEYSTRQCVPSDHMLMPSARVTPQIYRDLCPVLLYQIMPSSSATELCHGDHSHVIENKPQDQASVWLYSTLSIIVISLCGLLGVAVIPVMQQVFYHQLLQFLVALAVGTLCGDALLHLLPHALFPSGFEHGHTINAAEMAHNHDTSLVRGFIAMLGIVLFYFTEKCLMLISEWGKRRRHRQPKNQLVPKVLLMREQDGSASKPKESTMGGEKKLCKHKYSSYPYCYGEIADNPEGHLRNGPEGSPVCQHLPINNEANADTIRTNSVRRKQSNGPELSKENDIQSAEKKLLEANNESVIMDDSYTIIIREHENTHHGHSHKHGHMHSAPQSLSSVAWMVIMGDGFHNFTDGMAIGAAFASNIAGGFSTALAVFCHELPHELGDFAVLLKAGMSAKQAVFYNMLSSILCFIGMCLGIFLGHDEATTQWVFAGAAGMFIYIALVDMIPELTNSHSKEENSLCQCLLQFAGLMTGTGIMLLIAMYEHDLKHVFSD